MRKTYFQLSESSKERLSSVLERLHKSGLSVKDVEVMSNVQLKRAIGFKGKISSLEGFRRNVAQLQFTQIRKESISNRTLISYRKAGYRGKGLSRVSHQLRKGIGLNTFFDIAKKVQTTFNISKSQSYKRTDLILKKARVNYKKLSKREKEILSYFS